MTVPRIDRLSETPKALAHLVAELTEDALDAAAVGEWSPRTILAHLRDEEYLCARVWVERALAEHNPLVHGVGGESWAATRNRSRDRKEWLLADFALQRQASISILRMLRPEDWDRTIDRGERGLLTISSHLDAWLEHDAVHVAQLERAVGETLEEVRARRARMADSL
jgi:DinB superfamily